VRRVFLYARKLSLLHKGDDSHQRTLAHRRCALLLIIIFVFLFSVPTYGRVQVDSPSFILMESSTGRILYSRNERERRYPASLTKMLTALVAVEELRLDDVVEVGQEIRGMPAGFATNVHAEGDEITVRTLLYSLLVRSANETGRILALTTVRSREGRRNIPYEQAEQTFAALMNEKAQSLGARGTHFTNPFGAHSDNHFTTAYDLAIITRAFMAHPLLSEIAGTRVFENEDFSWTNTNQLLPHAPHGHPYITGAKAGFTTPAGHILASSAYNDGLGLVAVVLGGTDAARWQDTRRLIDYGFNNYRFREIAAEGEIIKTVLVENPRLGDSDTLDIALGESVTVLLNREEYAALTMEFTFDALLYTEEATFRAPIEEGMVIGTVFYVSNGITWFESPVFATRNVEERTFDSDMDYYLAAIFTNIFTRRALPYWFGFVGTGFGIFGIALAISAHRRVSRKAVWNSDKFKSRYSRYK